MQFRCYRDTINLQWEEKLKASEVFTIKIPGLVKQLLGTIHVPQCCTVMNAKASGGKHFVSNLAGLQRDEEEVAHPPAQKW